VEDAQPQRTPPRRLVPGFPRHHARRPKRPGPHHPCGPGPSLGRKRPGRAAATAGLPSTTVAHPMQAKARHALSTCRAWDDVRSMIGLHCRSPRLVMIYGDHCVTPMQGLYPMHTKARHVSVSGLQVGCQLSAPASVSM
jgi:hypothetical protein